MKYTVTIDDLKLINDRRDIPTLLNKMQAETICEIGVKEGHHFNSLISASYLKRAVAIDIWAETGVRSQNDDSYEQIRLDGLYNTMKALEARDKRVQVIKDFSPGVAAQFANESFDLVYIDADHTEEAVYIDLCAWWDKVRPGGVLSGHDYCDMTLKCPDGTDVVFGVIPAVNRFVSERGLSLHVDNEMPWRDWFIPKP
jgi:hypothetical protein